MIRTLNRVRLVGLLAAALATGCLQAAPLHLTGATVTGTATLNGTALALLGADSGYQAGAGTGTTAVVGGAGNHEFITDDGDVANFVDPSLQIDFETGGLLSFFDNTGLGTPGGLYTFSFVFSGLAAAIGDVVLDPSGWTGSVSYAITAPDTVSFTLQGVQFASPFGSFSAQLNAASAQVPLPGTLALACLALALMAPLAAPARRRQEV
ncbi:hypothetical protein D621_06675 [beta proteobacterium AAP51]|nr:hypothetical protein D621_06675 [beta proteobacterium AAP51]